MAPNDAPIGQKPAQLERDLEKFLSTKQQSDTVAYVLQQNALVVFAEMHIGAPQKAAFLSSIITALGKHKSHLSHFHASEAFFSDVRTWVVLQNYLAADEGRSLIKARRHLFDEKLRLYEPVLEAARRYPGRRYAVIGAGPYEHGEDLRHALIHGGFNGGITKFNQLHRENPITQVSKGNLLIGEFHATRQHMMGRATPTTSMLLLKDGWKLHVIRLSVGKKDSIAVTVTEMGTGRQVTSKSAMGDNFLLEPLGGGATIDMIAILNRVAGKKPLVCDIRGDKSPFALVKLEGGTDIPYNEMVDAILHLP